MKSEGKSGKGKGRTIIISNRLPVKLQKKDGHLVYKSSEGGLATGLGSIYKSENNIWVGWPGLYVVHEEEREKIKGELIKEKLYPVFLTKKDISDYYEGFSNETIWPNFHYFAQHIIYSKEFYEAYVKVNQKFANEVIKIANEDDTFWIHDYQLLLLPAMIREKLPDSSVGFFLHIPFPSYETFRLLPWRSELLKGMLGADLIGFHTSDYMRHFLNSVNKFLGITNIAGLLETGLRPVIVDTFPMGIDYEKYRDLAVSKKTRENATRFRKMIGDKKIILAIDRLDYTKGILERLTAFEMFLTEFPEFREKVSMLQVLVPSRDKVEKYRILKEEINRKVGSLNSSYGTLSWTPVFYYYRSYPIQSLSAFYKISDVALVTPLRDGMNLVCKEYIASRTNNSGVLILSEMAGASMELNDALIINPNDIYQVVSNLFQAFSMSPEEQRSRMNLLQEAVKRTDINIWVQSFMQRLSFCKLKQQQFQTKTIDRDILKSIINKYNHASKRMIFLDYDGTLMPFMLDPAEARPDTELLEILSELSADKKNRVILISGRDKRILDTWFRDYNIELIAEHGAWKKRLSEDWKPVTLLRNEWKEQIRPILEQYVSRTPGSFMEEKEFSLAWHFRRVEKGLGEIRSRELFYHLKDIIYHMDLQLLEGSMVLEIKNSEVNKGTAVLQYLSETTAKFIVAIGDDNTDEEIFRALPESAVTIKVRNNVSLAKYHYPTFMEVRKFLKNLIESSTQLK